MKPLVQNHLIRALFLALITPAIYFGTVETGRVHAAASLYLTASTTTVYKGGTFTIYPRVNTGGDATNAYAVNLTYSSLIRATSVSKGGSICTLYTNEPSFTGSTVTISCGLPTPGYNGSGGSLGSITFSALTKGTATISVAGSSQVLANDGSGTNILESRGSININIIDPPPPAVESPEVTCEPGEDGEWVSATDFTCTWNTPEGTTGFSYILTKDQEENPEESDLGDDTTKEYTGLEDGRYYFKIMAYGNGQWSNVTTYTLLVDTTPPTDLEILSEPRNETEIEELPMISFNATDALSGVEYYEIKIDDGEWIQVESPYQIESISSGEHTISVRAVDKAGNISTESIVLTIAEVQPPIITSPEDGAVLPIAENLVVEGTTMPDSLVYIYLNGEKIGEVTSDADGYFSFTYKKLLKGGDYKLHAVTVNPGGIQSANSDTVNFSVDVYAIRIGRFVIPSICAGSGLIILFALMGFFIIFLRKRKKDYKDQVEKNVKSAQKSTAGEFDELHQSVRKGIGTVLSDPQNLANPLGLEHKLEEEIKKKITQAKEDIDHAIEDVPPSEPPLNIKDKIKGIPGWFRSLRSKKKEEKDLEKPAEEIKKPITEPLTQTKVEPLPEKLPEPDSQTPEPLPPAPLPTTPKPAQPVTSTPSPSPQIEQTPQQLPPQPTPPSPQFYPQTSQSPPPVVPPSPKEIQEPPPKPQETPQEDALETPQTYTPPPIVDPIGNPPITGFHPGNTPSWQSPPPQAQGPTPSPTSPPVSPSP